MWQHIAFLLGLTCTVFFGCSQSAAPPTPQSQSATSNEGTALQICRIAAELFGLNASDIKPSTSLGDLGADDLDVVELIMELEDRFDVSIPDKAITDVTGIDNWQAGINRLTMAKLADIVDQQKR